MSKMKQRKRLGLLGLVFLLVFLAGSAFAFVPGMLDTVGRIGITEIEDDYVQWIYVATQGPVLRGVVDFAAANDPAAPGTDYRTGFSYSTRPEGDRAALHGTGSSGVGSISALPGGADSPIYLSHARIVDQRDRTNQRIEWSVVFDGAGMATLYAQAMNFNENSAVVISNARVVELTDFGPIGPFSTFDTDAWIAGTRHALDIDAEHLNDMFTVAMVNVAGFEGTFPANNALSNSAASSTGMLRVQLTWDGTLPLDLDDDDIEFWQWIEDYDAHPTLSAPGWYSADGPVTDGSLGLTVLPEIADDGDIFMVVLNDDDEPIAFDALMPWIGTFVLEFDYALAP